MGANELSSVLKKAGMLARIKAEILPKQGKRVRTEQAGKNIDRVASQDTGNE